MGRKAQAALEFLTTYAWAFIVILVTIGSLYYFGVFDVSRFVPERCQFSPQIACTDFTITTSSVSAKFSNTLGEDINITSAEITSDSAVPIVCTSPIRTYPLQPTHLKWESGIALDINFTSCQGGGLFSGERMDAKVRLVYHAVGSPSKTPHSIQGRISGRVIG